MGQIAKVGVPKLIMFLVKTIIFRYIPSIWWQPALHFPEWPALSVVFVFVHVRDAFMSRNCKKKPVPSDLPAKAKPEARLKQL